MTMEHSWSLPDAISTTRSPRILRMSSSPTSASTTSNLLLRLCTRSRSRVASMDSTRSALRPKGMTVSFTELPHHLHKLIKGHRCRRCLRITGVTLGKRFLFSLPAPLFDAFLIVDDALFNCPALEEHERLWTSCHF